LSTVNLFKSLSTSLSGVLTMPSLGPQNQNHSLEPDPEVLPESLNSVNVNGGVTAFLNLEIVRGGLVYKFVKGLSSSVNRSGTVCLLKLVSILEKGVVQDLSTM